MWFSHSLIYSCDTLMLSDVKADIFGEDFCDQMKELSDNGSGMTSSGHDLFVERGKNENKRNHRCSTSKKPGG